MMIVRHEDQEKENWRPGVETRMHVSARNGAAQLCIFEQWVAPGCGAPIHSHTVEEVLTVLAGEAEIWLGDIRSMLSSGQSLIIPAHRTHGFRNIGAAELRLIAVLASPVFEMAVDGSGEAIQRWLPRAGGSG